MQGGSDDEEKDVDETENPKLDDKRLEFCQFIKGWFKTLVFGIQILHKSHFNLFIICIVNFQTFFQKWYRQLFKALPSLQATGCCCKEDSVWPSI